MPHYFYVHDARSFADQTLPVLADCRRERSFQPLRRLIPYLRLPADDSSILALAAAGIPFDRHVFQAVVGQSLIFGAESVPRLPLEPETLIALLAPKRLAPGALDRTTLTRVEQVFWGSRDLMIDGRPYRPFQVGWNNLADVDRLARFLQAIDPHSWTPDQLRPRSSLPADEDRQEELALVRDWWPELLGMYSDAQAQGLVIVCEE